MSGIRGSHHVLGIEHLGGEFRNGDGTVLLASTSSQRSETNHEEVQTGEGNQVGLELVQVDVQGAVEAEGRGDGGDDLGDQTVQVGVAWLSDAETLLADVEDSLVVDLRHVLRELLRRGRYT